jgi:hypothetical protein
MYFFKAVYIFFIILSLNIFFFSTSTVNAEAFLVDEIEISEKLENNFNKEILINKGFEKAFDELIYLLVKSSDKKKIKNTDLNKIKSMIESFSIKEEKFINESYHLNLGVSFNKKKIFNFLEKKNIFPAQIIKETFLFIPIIIDQQDGNLLVFSDNSIYKNWNSLKEKILLINYILPSEDLEDLNTIKDKSAIIENYDFKQIIEKYFLDYSIVALIFKDNNEIKVLSKISIRDKKIIKNDSFKSFDLDDEKKTMIFINELKIIYEDLWKNHNQINTSIKTPLMIEVSNQNLNTSLEFEKILNKVDLISDYSIIKLDKNIILYKIIFNGTPQKFINIMNKKKHIFDTQKKIWILK